jgi:hypothetical protein
VGNAIEERGKKKEGETKDKNLVGKSCRGYIWYQRLLEHHAKSH